jgi:hypothetical protein
MSTIIEDPTYRVWKYDGVSTYVLDHQTTNWAEAKDEAAALYSRGFETLVNEKDKPTLVHFRTDSPVWNSGLGPQIFAAHKDDAQHVDASFFEKYPLDTKAYDERQAKELTKLAAALDSDARSKGILPASEDPVYKAQIQGLQNVTAAINSGDPEKINAYLQGRDDALSTRLAGTVSAVTPVNKTSFRLK